MIDNFSVSPECCQEALDPAERVDGGADIDILVGCLSASDADDRERGEAQRSHKYPHCGLKPSNAVQQDASTYSRLLLDHLVGANE